MFTYKVFKKDGNLLDTIEAEYETKDKDTLVFYVGKETIRKFQLAEIRNYKKKTNCWRLFFSILYLVVPIIILLIIWLLGQIHKMFYPNVYYKTESGNFYRLLWCGFGCMWGLSAVTFQWIKQSRGPFPEYLERHPYHLLVISLLVFSIMHLFAKTSGYLFYYFSFPLCLVLGFQVDRFWNIFFSFLEEAKKGSIKLPTKYHKSNYDDCRNQLYFPHFFLKHPSLYPNQGIIQGTQYVSFFIHFVNISSGINGYLECSLRNCLGGNLRSYSLSYSKVVQFFFILLATSSHITISSF